MDINERSPEIAAFYDEWRSNRAMIEGERAVKAGGETYLPRNRTMDVENHRILIQRTDFFPGASRTWEGLRAMASSKPAKINAPENVRDVLNTITRQGDTVDDLADRIFGELLITNFVGLVVDYPTANGPLTQAQAIDQGVRPWVGMYIAETILCIETAVVKNRQQVNRVVLQDDKDSIRELRLDDGVYTVTKWSNVKGQWTAIETITPTRGGTVMSEIPFTLVSTERNFAPSKAPLTDICSLNRQLFIASSNCALLDWYLCSPIPHITRKTNDDDPEYSVSPGTIWLFDNDPKEVNVGVMEYTGAHASVLADRVATLKNDMAKMGNRMLADDKAAAEAAETLAIRRASENAMIANLTRVRDRKLNYTLSWVSWWLGLAEGVITYEASTSFNVMPLDAPALTFRKSLLDGGVISKDAFLDILIENDVLPETYDREADAQKIAEELADRPPAIVMPTVGQREDAAS